MGYVSLQEDIQDRLTDSREWDYLEDSPKNRASSAKPKPIPMNIPFEHDDIPLIPEGHRELVSYLKELLSIEYIPSLDWIYTYFELVKELLDFTKLKNSDLRVLMSLTKPKTFHAGKSDLCFLNVTIRSPYVLVAHHYPGNLEDNGDTAYTSVGITCASGTAAGIEEWKQDLVNLRVYFKTRNEMLLLRNIRDAHLFRDKWLYQARHLSTARCATRVRYPRSHKPMFYKAVVDYSYREKVLDEVFDLSRDTSKSFHVGDRVTGAWKNGDTLFPGHITAIHGKYVHIKYDDGDKEWTTLSNLYPPDEDKNLGVNFQIDEQVLYQPHDDHEDYCNARIIALYQSLSHAYIQLDNGDRGWVSVWSLIPLNDE